jgi:hypothetical protein
MMDGVAEIGVFTGRFLERNMGGWMGGWVDGSMGGWVDGSMGRWVDGEVRSLRKS